MVLSTQASKIHEAYSVSHDWTNVDHLELKQAQYGLRETQAAHPNMLVYQYQLCPSTQQ